MTEEQAAIPSGLLGDSALKILTIAGPLLASSLAITYDVGFFAGVGNGFFSFFSLSEHIVFTLQSLPFAIAPVIVLLLWFTSGWYSHRMWNRIRPAEGQAARQMSKLELSIVQLDEFVRPRRWVRLSWLVTTILIMVSSIWTARYTTGFLLASLLIYLANGPDIHKAWRDRSRVFFATCAVASLMLSFLIGLERAAKLTNGQSASEVITVDDKSIPARLIRGGERGVLFFSLENKKVRFLRWDSIKQIETL
ncbi:hypothetical protein FJN17_23070 [Bradyrhizobium symbiodeficiens]|uniref:Uncharacterized protein n=1 Tax=Bradyrhizobium symbiodeficiens TaxID=1404367 RepID=A0ABX5WAE6_9BRAD|nr:hypothetical protein [Bradyrhizobium symbiodeficiens]QDF40219.1 hypothetical protein FJN17_23070 [Bradyrhizobium symbiodeficiens]